MENASYKVFSNGTILYFDGCDLVDAEYEEDGEEVKFGANWFIDEFRNRVDIEIEEDERHPHDDSDDPLYVYVKIENSIVKKLEIFNYANGTLYLEPSDDDVD